MSEEELIAELRYAGDPDVEDRPLMLRAADALTRSQSRIEELEEAISRYLTARAEGRSQVAALTNLRQALTNSEQGRTP